MLFPSAYGSQEKSVQSQTVARQVHGNTADNRHEAEATQGSLGRGVDEQEAACRDNAVGLSLTRRGNSGTLGGLRRLSV